MVKKWFVQIPVLSGEAKRRIYLYLPDSYKKEPEKHYPVMYMFDGHNVFFDSDPVMSDNLNTFGYNLGKWIYIVDAVSDVVEDKKKKQYNVLLECSDYYDFTKQEPSENIVFTMNMCLANTAGAWENIKRTVKDKKGIKTDLFAIIDNLVYLGMRNVSDKIIGGQRSERPI